MRKPFIKKAMSICRHGSFLGWITPSNWRRPEHPLFPILYDKILYIHIYDKSAGKKIFGAQTRFDLYVISSEGYSQKPIPLLVDEHGETYHNKIIPKNWPFYPNSLYDKIKTLLTWESTLPPTSSSVELGSFSPTVKPSNDGITVIYDSSVYDARVLTKRPTHVHKFPVIHTLTAKGMGIRYAKHKFGKHFGVPKVILNFNEKQYPVNDYYGKYGMSQLSFGIPIRDKTEGERVINCLETPVFQDIIKATKWGSFQTDYRMFKYFRKDFVNILCPNSSSGKDTFRVSRDEAESALPVLRNKSAPHSLLKNISSRRLPSVKHNRTKKK